jgi:4-diphosphocytidyl-2-C-methyl-D-erythritol kinase
MNSAEMKARAKINLSLDVLRKREDGYHEVKMIMQLVQLHDRISLDIIPKGIQVVTDCPWLPAGNGNTVYRAAELIKNRFSISKGIRIKIRKRIPVAAGLAGGSSDAAAVIKGMNRLFDLKLGERELMAIGKQVGADVPYCIMGRTALAEGIGELLTELQALPRLHIVLIKPKIHISTKWVYENLDLDKVRQRPDTDRLLKAITEGNFRDLARNMVNVLETVTIKKYPVIGEIKERLLSLGAAGSLMSGSGPTVFGIFEGRHAARLAYNSIKSCNWYSCLTETFVGGDK